MGPTAPNQIFFFKMIPTFTCDRRRNRTLKISRGTRPRGPPEGTFMIGIIWAMRKS